VTDNPVAVLLADNVSMDDISFITEKSKDISAALAQMTIICKEELVASIGVDKPLIAPAV